MIVKKIGKQRIQYIDLAKGIVILLVILGHTIGIKYSINNGKYISEILLDFKQQVIRGSIFSFHMPFFFIVSALTFKKSSSIDDFKKNTFKSFNHLMVPVLIMYLFRLTVTIRRWLITFKNHTFFFNALMSIIWTSGAETMIGNIKIYEIGMIWFFVALFVGRTIYDYYQIILKDKKMIIVMSFLLSIIGVSISKMIWLPFSFDIALAIQPFFSLAPFVNVWINKNEKNRFMIVLNCVLVWGSILLLEYFTTHSYFELAQRRYPLYPFPFISAFAATIIILQLSKLFENYSISKPFIFIGQNSMLLLVIHYFDYMIISLWCNPDNILQTIMFRMIMDLSFFLIIKGSIAAFMKKDYYT